MSEEEDILSIEKPEQLTIPQLKSKLASLGLELPMKNEKKQVYVDLFKKLQAEKKSQQQEKVRKRNEPETPTEKEVDVDQKSKKAKVDSEEVKTPKKSTKRKSNPFQSGSEREIKEITDRELEGKTKKAAFSFAPPPTSGSGYAPQTTPVATPTRAVRAIEPANEEQDTEKPKVPEVTDTVRGHSKPRVTLSEITSNSVTTELTSPSATSTYHSQRRQQLEASTPTSYTRITTPTRAVQSRVSLSEPSMITEDSPISTSTYRSQRRQQLEASTPTSYTRTTTPTRAIQSRVSLSETPVVTAAGDLPTTSTYISQRRQRWKSEVPTSNTGTIPATEYIPRRDRSSRLPPPSRPVAVAPPPVEPVPEGSEIEKGQTIWQWLYLSTVLVVWALVWWNLFLYGPLGGKVPSFLVRTTFCSDLLDRDCTPCPPNGTCKDGTLTCDSPFVRVGDSCAMNPEIEKGVQRMLQHASYFLQTKNGRYDCGYDDQNSVTEDQLKTELRKSNIVYDNNFDITFETFKVRSLRDSGFSLKNGKYFSTEKILPWGCAIRNFLWDLRYHFLGVLITFALILFAAAKKKQADTEREQAKSYAEATYSMLQEQALHAQQSGGDGYIAVLHIRDTLLVPPIDTKKRDRIWKQIEMIIKQDTRVQEQTLLHHGEQQTVWEWTAPVHHTGIFSPNKTRSTEDYYQGLAYDEGSTSAAERRYPDLFPSRAFQ